jgi:hypothetical protein
MLTATEFQRYFEGGKSMTVATADGTGLPTACRAVGMRLDADGRGVVVYLPLATAPKSIANIATNGRIAICVSDVIDHSTLQLKGMRRAVRVACPDEAAVVTRWLHAFTDQLDRIGMPKCVTLGLSHWPAFAIEVDIDELYEQTPGPRAGVLVGRR